MKIIRVLLLPLFVATLAILCGSGTATGFATMGNEVVIAQVQTGAEDAASQEYVSIYNNTNTDIDVTGWCLFYKDSLSKPGCIVPTNPADRLWLASYSYTTFASHEFIAAHADIPFIPQANTGFSGGMADGGGFLSLVDANGVVRDQFTWVSKAPAGQIYQRLPIDVSTLQDTGDDAADFVLTELVISPNPGLYVQTVPVDVCPNILGVQAELPDGYLYDTDGSCQQDMCSNLDGLQKDVPDGYQHSSTGECTTALLESVTLVISELLPNTSSYDTGNEFIELYNPNNHSVALTGYQLKLEPSASATYTFISGTIAAGQYQTFSDTDVGFSLPNSSASLLLVAPTGDVVSNSDLYSNPKDNIAWALIDGTWQFTDRPTPNQPNLESSMVLAALVKGATLDPCPAGKYRNPATNRCRTIEVKTSLSSCGLGKYRNPETNRCRNLVTTASSALTPCKPGQVRNPATNRCRSDATDASTLKQCQQGQERNPETNRCRKVLSAAASSQPQDEDQSSHKSNVLIIGAVLSVIIGYALYEYRYDMLNLYMRLRHKR